MIGQGWAKAQQRSTTWSINAKADGTLFSPPGGDVKLAVGADYRDEEFNGLSKSFITLDTVLLSPALGGTRTVSSVFSEIVIPVFGAANARPGLRNLAFSLAGRFEDYSDFGTSFDPKLGVQWSPIGPVRLRGSIGTAFKAPNLTDTDETRLAVEVQRLTDPASPSGQSLAILLRGGNAELKEETAITWSAGIDYRPDAVVGLTAQLTYFDLDYEDRIDDPSSGFTVLQNETFFAPLISRNPSPEAVQRWFSHPRFTDSIGVSPEDVVVIVDARKNNLATTQVRGIDLFLGYGFDTRFGRLDLSASGSYLIDFTQSVTETSPVFEVVDTINHPVDLRMRAGVTWTRGALSASSFVNYADPYTDTVSQPTRSVDSWATVDLQVRYAFEKNAGLLDDLSISLSALNLFDEEPPFVNNPVGIAYDPDNADALGRFISIELAKRF